MSAPQVLVRTSEPPRLRVGARLRELFQYREVLANLTRKEMKVKYKSTVLGVVWSMLNPILYLVVFYVAFRFFLRTGPPDFGVYLLSGILPWTLFSTGLTSGTGSVVANGPLVSKVAFPREILPLSVIGSSLVNFLYQLSVLVAFMLLFGYPLFGRGLVLLPFALADLLLFTVALSFATSALNVRYRDTGHLVELALLAWFWATPIVYQASLVMGNLPSGAIRLYLLNPMTNVVLAFQRSLYGGISGETLAQLPDPGLAWYAMRLGALAAGSIALLLAAWWVFYRLSGDFAEEL